MAQEMRKIGRYQITRELGRGAMGVVYHAIDPTIGRAVAIKTLRLREVDDSDQRARLRERLFREARSAGALSHPGIVTIYDMDEVDGLAYIAMEYVDGETLDELLRRPQGISRERVTEVWRQAAAALDYAHRKGIIHRDIKPANIMIDATGAVKITDFGIAKITQLEGQTLTGVLIGTPNYMSPEQVQGHETDGRSDQFSLSVIAYEMLSGERPFHGDQISTVVYKIVTEQPTPVQNVNTTLNDGVDKVLRRGMAKKPERRFASCTAFATALAGALENTKNWRVLPQKAYQSIPTAATGAVTGTMPPARKFLTNLEKRNAKRKSAAARKRGWLVPFLAAFLVLMVLLGAVAWQAGVLDLPWLQERLADEGAQHDPATDGSAPEKSALEKTATEKTAPEKTDATPPAGSMPPAETNPAETIPADAASSLPPAIPPASGGPESAQPAVSSPVNRPPAATVRPPAPSATFQQVQVMTDPPGSRAMLDGLGDAICQTPCNLRVRSGVHTLTVTRDGYQPESREITVAHDDIDYPLITLRSANGMLLLTSDPSSAHVWVDGRPTDFVTPVRISLPAGAHTISIQKNGLQTYGEVQIQNGALSTLRLSVQRR